jgi:YHS domain-containing protein
MFNTQLSRRAAISGIAFTIFGAAPAYARTQEIYLDTGGLFGSAWDYAVDGFDVVAYFDLEDGEKPVAGKDELTTEYKDVMWRFSSQENLDAFRVNPDQYRPQYGGYCAWAMARNKFAKGAPDIWSVYNGKLYLNVGQRYKRKWLSNIDHDIDRANANWPGILDRD